MTQSPAHQFGQIIGDALELAVAPLLQEFAAEHHLYLDKKGLRPARRGTKVRWTDLNGNTHDLDFVLEAGGSAEQIGTPVAFIEAAWRRYTKHSRNKAQEIQGAIPPLAAAYQGSLPFVGAILAGVFTTGALVQLRSLGFAILYFPYELVIHAFNRAGVDAYFDETTPDAAFAEKVRVWKALAPEQHKQVAAALIQSNAEEVALFIRALNSAITRQIESVQVLPLHGLPRQWTSVAAALEFIGSYDESIRPIALIRYEIEIRYLNGDVITGQFGDKERAIAFLHVYQRPGR